jgi:hypothetical protein
MKQLKDQLQFGMRQKMRMSNPREVVEQWWTGKEDQRPTDHEDSYNEKKNKYKQENGEDAPKVKVMSERCHGLCPRERSIFLKN